MFKHALAALLPFLLLSTSSASASPQRVDIIKRTNANDLPDDFSDFPMINGARTGFLDPNDPRIDCGYTADKTIISLPPGFDDPQTAKQAITLWSGVAKRCPVYNGRPEWLVRRDQEGKVKFKLNRSKLICTLHQSVADPVKWEFNEGTEKALWSSSQLGRVSKIVCVDSKDKDKDKSVYCDKPADDCYCTGKC